MGGLIMLIAVVVSLMLHELGHFLTARATGMKVTEFFLGFGPKLWSTRRGETEFGIKAIPIGGYNRIVGMDPLEEIDPADAGRTYRDKKFWQKSVVIMSGVVIHFLLAYVIFLGILLGYGILEFATTVATVQPTLKDGTPTPAALAGLESGDRIISVDGVATATWKELERAIAVRPNTPVEIVIVRGGTEMTVRPTLTATTYLGKTIGFLGFEPVHHTEHNVVRSVGVAGQEVGGFTAETFAFLGNLIKPSSLARLAGAFVGKTDVPLDIRPVSPVGIVHLGEGRGTQNLLWLIAALNVVLGVFNGLPLFPLDGGHFVIALYEKVSRRKANMRVLMPIAAAVMMLVIFLFSVALLLDITNPITIP